VISVGSDIQDADGSAMEATVEAVFTTAPLPFTGTIAFADLTGIWLIERGWNESSTAYYSLRTTTTTGAPAWSPACDRIAFQRYTGIGKWLWDYVVNADGTNLVGLSPPGVSDQEPTWSPDGQRNRLRKRRYTAPFNRRLYIMNADGTHRVLLIALRQPTEFPAWSPADRIAFTSYGSTTGADIFVVNPDGTNLTTLWTIWIATGTRHGLPTGAGLPLRGMVISSE
jgi:Tol biopolymer transport system component